MRAASLALLTLSLVPACNDEGTGLCAADGSGCACKADTDCGPGLHCYKDRCLPEADSTGAASSDGTASDGTAPTTTAPDATATTTATSEDMSTGTGPMDQTICHDLDAVVEPGAFAGLEDTIELAGGQAIAAVRVEVEVRTPDASQIDLTLAGAQKFTALYTGGQCNQGPDVRATFDAAGGQAIGDTCPEGQGITGTVLPDGDLGVFAGRDTGGPWTLRVRDIGFSESEVVLERWCVYVDAMPGPVHTDKTEGDAIWLRPKSLGDASLRIFGAWAHDEARDVVVGFGGCLQVGQPYSCLPTPGDYKMTVEWDGVEWRDIDTASHPGGPGHHMAAMAYDPLAGEVVLFGGYPDSGFNPPLAETWTYEGSAWTQRTPAHSPTARAGHTMVWDPAHSQIVLYGGHDELAQTVMADLWAWDGSDWTELPSAGGPGARHHHAATWNPVLGRMMVFGGWPDPGYPNLDGSAQLWSYDPGSGAWQQHEDAPVGIGASQIAHDGARDRIIMFGGRSGTLGNSYYETYEWDGAAWTALLRPVWEPDARFGHGMLWLPTRGVTFLYGGRFNQSWQDTWYYTPVP
ncbi:Kelch repeat-containing protein [Nannocystis radixulma]|uniref:Kelch repeat-containing protein n=1 Tax=Nannocystis radixulma TaxID=2995305 RepID=A0ABT5B181_9BACT|nr:kelch repeat-containing protein [Nannocystis radixulma]MDC0667861.1 kelch repeat-containing protein [Nannocystis radixulma]